MGKLIYLSFFALLSLTQVYSQNLLQGTFVEESHPWYMTNKFIFNKNNEFEYWFITDTGDEYGRGNYTLSNSKLILLFDNKVEEKVVNKGKFSVDSTYSLTGDSLEFLFKVIDFNGKPLEGTVCVLKDSLKTITGSATNYEGISKIVVYNKYLNFTFIFSNLGYKTLKIQNYGMNSKKITVMLDKSEGDYPTIKSGTITKYDFKSESDSVFFLKDSLAKDWIKFKKVNN